MKTKLIQNKPFRWLMILSVAAIAFSACNNDDDTNAGPTANATDRQFMQTAKLGNNAEIKTSQLALSRSQDNDVRNFAQMMITHHTAANKSLDSLAQLRGVTLPDTAQLNADARALYDRLNTLRDTMAGTGTNNPVPSTDFSREYTLGQVTLHTKAQGEYQAYINNSQAQDAGVKNYATKTLPIVNSHLQMAQRMVTDKGYDR